MNAFALAAMLSRWNGLPGRIRWAVGLTVTLAIALSIVAGIVANAPRVSLFATPLRAEQLAEVEERLAEWNVAFTPTADNAIVDAARRNDLLLRLSLDGVPHAHVENSAEALDGVGVLTPPEVIDQRTRAGLAGDIELALRSVDGVDDARVIIAPSKPAEFGSDSGRDASASVRLRLRSAGRLSPDTIAGVRRFVASGVAGLDPANVTILDDRGVALDDSAGPGVDGGDLQRSLQGALDAAFGAGSTIVRVRTEYDRHASSRREVSRAPLSNVVIAQDRVSETYAGEGKRYEKRANRDDRGSDLRETNSSFPAGGIARISTAVFVDAGRSFDIAKVRDLSAAVVGYDPGRGDRLAVRSVTFGRAFPARPSRWWVLYGAFAPLLPALIFVAGLIAAARYGARPVSRVLRYYARRTTIAERSGTLLGVAPARVHSALEKEPAHAAAAIISALPAATAAAVLEMYPQHEREAIVRRMQRRVGPLVPSLDDVLGYRA